MRSFDMKNNKKKSNKFLATIKEIVRKFFVTLKKNPSFIPFVMLIISFLVFSLNLSYIAPTTNVIGKPGMGLCEFATMLFSLLSMVCLLNAFPKRKKPNYPMVAILIVFAGIIIACDVIYVGKILERFNEPDPIKPENLLNFQTAYQVVYTHTILVAITAVTIILEPVIAKLLKKINTSVELETTNIANIELSDDE